MSRLDDGCEPSATRRDRDRSPTPRRSRMLGPCPARFGVEEVWRLAAALSTELPTPQIPGPRLPLQERQALAARCTALCQGAKIRARESIIPRSRGLNDPPVFLC